MGSPAQTRPPRLIELRSGGWVLLLAGGLIVLAVGLRLPHLIDAMRRPMLGDGVNVDSYGFDFSTCLVPRGPIVAAGFSKDAVPALDDPPMLTLAEADEFHRRLRRDHHTKYLIDKDRVIGVAIAGDLRAYPIRLLSWHQVVNDTVGGVPIAVTYDPLCDSAVVFDRRVAGDTLRFGVSGLLYNSNLLLHDRRDDPRDESLWSQLQFRAIAGPAVRAARSLTLIPAQVQHWAAWREQHPDTRVMALLLEHLESYKISYAAYYASEELKFPAEPAPTGPALKAPTLAVRMNGAWYTFLLDEIRARADTSGCWQTTLGGTPVVFDYHAGPPTVRVTPAEPTSDFALVHALRFAWQATHGP